MRKVNVDVTVRMTITVNDDTPVENVLEEMDYGFIDQTDRATIEDTCITDWEIKDSR